MELLNFLSLDNPYLQQALSTVSGLLENQYVLHTIFAFASFALGLLGFASGQRLVNAKCSLIFGAAIGGGAVWLLFTPFGAWAPAFASLFLFTYLGSKQLAKMTSAAPPGPPKPAAGGGSGGAGGSK